MLESTKLKKGLQEEARACGFDTISITTADAIPEAAQHLRSFLEQERHGEMTWMLDNVTRRSTPKNLWSDVNTVIMLGMNYASSQDPLDTLKKVAHGNISTYAQGEDYHDIIKKKLKLLARWFVKETQADVKVFVDTAPVMEKPLAQAAGMGWQGKHTNLVSRDFGSWLFLGSIFTNFILEPDTPSKDYCGSCQNCLDICPTNAFPQPYQLDAKRCISYLTIESKTQVPLEFRAKMGNHIYGCDDCLAVCPWNKYATQTQEMKFHTKIELTNKLLIDFVQLTDTGFRQLFRKSPVKRLGRDRFVRNVLIAMGNAKIIEMLPYIKTCLSDESDLVRGMAIWSMGQYEPKSKMNTLAKAALPYERIKHIRQEWEIYL